jgi:DNA polymerase
MLVGEAPGADEVRLHRPFVGAAGNELNRMLGEAGISRSECFVTNVCRVRPPGNDINAFIPQTKKEVTSEHILIQDKYVSQPIREGIDLLAKEIQAVQPNIIIAFGNTSLWALTSLWGITRWRGSMLYSSFGGRKVIPTFHPAAILRQWELRAIAIHDLKRAARFRDGRAYPNPEWIFTIRPTFDEAVSRLYHLISLCDQAPIEISFDLETKSGHIDCAGFAWSKTESICIPFCKGPEHYWEALEEGYLVWLIYKLLTHPNCRVIGQNLLYDSQYTYRRWGFIPNVYQDTMISHHVAFVGLPKKLDFQASMYCEHYVQWKKERGQWKEGG